jgi:hypothetical protein
MTGCVVQVLSGVNHFYMYPFHDDDDDDDDDDIDDNTCVC